jgi:TRAP-type C4-dicarboxylate transport system substrate-binding protein
MALRDALVETLADMLKALACCALLSFSLLARAAAAEPIKLKLSYFTSDTEVIYRSAVKPFVDSVNAAANGLIEIDVYASGSLGKSYIGQMQLLLDGVADFAFVNPALTPEEFPDDGVLELPGLFRDVREATTVYTRLVASGALRGYQDFTVIAALSGGPQNISTRMPISSLQDLQGKKIRAANRTEVATLNALGMSATIIPINQTAEAIGRGTVDGATGPAAIMNDFGISRVTSCRYLIRMGFPPLAILMNKKKFDSLPAAAQDIIRKSSGEWLAALFTQTFEADNDVMMKQFKSDPRRTTVLPSQADLDTAQAVFDAQIKDWQARNPRNIQLLGAVETELGKLRSVR